jgi:hypothetical protein
MHKQIILLFLLYFTALHYDINAQDTGKPQKTFKQDDVFVIFTKKANLAKRDSLTAKPVELHKPYFSTTPYVGYNPAYGLLIGVGSTIGLYLGRPETTPISTAVVAINLTTKSQLIFNLRTNIMTNKSKFIFRGDWRFLLFSQPTYGLGTGVAHQGNIGIIFNDGGQTGAITAEEEPINYNYIRLYETFYFKITKKWYAGIGYNLDDYKKVVDQKLNLDTVPQQITHHYQYSTDHGFNPSQQTMSGLSLELLMDSRDNSIRPTRGYFVDIAFRPNFTFLGSTKNSIMLNTEFRTYVNVSKRRPDHLVGFWYIGQFSRKGDVPYLALPAIAWDMYNRTGRGYVQGSIRGVNFLYGESEYRFPISKYTGILGGVVFVNATTASSDDGSRDLFEYMDPAVGVGLRVMFNRKTLSNLSVDLGFGAGGEVGIYFNLNETF